MEALMLNIEDKDRDEAQFMSRSFTVEEVKNRVYINALGAEVVSRFLASSGIDTSDLHNMHSVSKIIEDTDISDILLTNIHIDVRVVFDENQIFVPVSHSELGITPDIYVVLKLSKNDFSRAELLGYFNPAKIDRNRKNSLYYFVKKEDLSDADSLADFVKNFNGNTSRGISEDKIYRGRMLSVSLADHDISFEEKKELFSLLLSSDQLRESVLEFDNFETLSYNTAPVLEQLPPLEIQEQNEEETSEEQDADTTDDSETSSEDAEEQTEEQSKEDENNVSEEEGEDSNTVEEKQDETEQPVEDLDTADIADDILISSDDSEVPKDMFSPDLDITIDDIYPDKNSASETKENNAAEDKKEDENIAEKAVKTTAAAAASAIGTAAEMTASAASAGIEAAAAETVIPGTVAAQGAMDLAGLAGELVQSLPDPLPAESDENLLDFSQVPAAIQNEDETANVRKDYDEPKDLTELDTIEDFSDNQTNSPDETVDFSDMQTVAPAEVNENTNADDTLTDLSNLEHKDDEDMDFLEDLASEETNDKEDTDSELPDNEYLMSSEEQKDNTDDDIEISEPEDSADLPQDTSSDTEEVSASNQNDDENYDLLNEDDFEILEDDEENHTNETEEEKTETGEKENKEETSDDNWVSDINYDNLEDIESPEPEITESAEDTEKTSVVMDDSVKAIENSTVISDKNFAVGEIDIDINKPEELVHEGSEHLEDLYQEKENIPGGSLLNSPGLLGKPSKGFGLGLLGIVTTLIIVGIIGVFVAKMAKKPTEEAPQPITDSKVNTETPQDDSNALNVDEGNVVKMDNVSPISPAAVQSKQPVSEPQLQPVQSKRVMSATQFLEVNKLSWEAPDYVAADKNFRQYFQSAGKSLKLSLTSDLLLANDYIYSDQVRVSVNFAQDGTLKDTKILLSSGSQQVDKIVLQTVNQTLSVLKAPHSVGNNSGTTVVLKIYF